MVNMAKLQVEWYVNGVPLQTGHRFQTTQDFGYVVCVAKCSPNTYGAFETFRL